MLRTRLSLLRPTSRTPIISRKWAPQRWTQTTAAPIQAAKPAPPKRRFRFVYLWYGAMLFTGVSLGFAIRQFAAPNALPLPGSRDDETILRSLTKDLEALDVVQFMRSHSERAHSAAPPEKDKADTERKAWVELDIKTHITESKDDWGAKTRTMTGESMAGTRGLGVQRAFWNAETKELVAVVWIGSGLSGWPGLAHGGAITTIFQDCMSRMVAGPDASVDTVPQPTSMSVTYAKPTNSTSFYILRGHFSEPKLPQAAPPPDAEPAPAKSWLPSWKDLTKKEPPTKPQRTVEIIGTLENVEGQLCVRAKGIFPVTD